MISDRQGGEPARWIAGSLDECLTRAGEIAQGLGSPGQAPPSCPEKSTRSEERVLVNHSS
jgi:hypothetical protein